MINHIQVELQTEIYTGQVYGFKQAYKNVIKAALN